MQLEAEIVAIGSGILSALFTTGISYGILKSKVDQLEKSVDKVEEGQKNLVSMDYFNLFVTPLREELKDMKNDIKTILKRISEEN